jgi:hypothetical protein
MGNENLHVPASAGGVMRRWRFDENGSRVPQRTFDVWGGFTKMTEYSKIPPVGFADREKLFIAIPPDLDCCMHTVVALLFTRPIRFVASVSNEAIHDPQVYLRLLVHAKRTSIGKLDTMAYTDSARTF